MAAGRATTDRREKGHFARIFVLWLILAVPTFYLLMGPLRTHLPPGAMSDSASGARFDMAVLAAFAAPVVEGVLVYMAYAIIVWRHPKGQPIVDGPPLRSNLKVQGAWIAITSTIVMGMFVYGTYELVVPAGAGGGEGPSPIWQPAAKHILPIQVIGQQWKFTYRYPTYGGFETDQLIIPNNTEIAFHVTSLDVIHSFWAYQIGIKADANPQVDNVAYTKTQQLGSFTVRCDELCGVWHGAMFNYGHVVTPAAFAQWATQTEKRLAINTKLLPPLNYGGYTPSANGASGQYYPTQDSFSKIEEYPVQ